MKNQECSADFRNINTYTLVTVRDQPGKCDERTWEKPVYCDNTLPKKVKMKKLKNLDLKKCLSIYKFLNEHFVTEEIRIFEISIKFSIFFLNSP